VPSADEGFQHVSLVTGEAIILLDVRSMKAVEEMPLQTGLLTSQDSYSGLARAGMEIPDCFAASIRAYREKVFLLVSHAFSSRRRADTDRPARMFKLGTFNTGMTVF
jgi:hypothetical protein